jgi:hypothetical protein
MMTGSGYGLMTSPTIAERYMPASIHASLVNPSGGGINIDNNIITASKIIFKTLDLSISHP